MYVDLVFDAYKVEGFPGEIQQYHNIYVVYTKEAETADQYIEKVAHEIGRKYEVTVATSDGTEQVIIRGQGCHLLSAKELYTGNWNLRKIICGNSTWKKQKVRKLPLAVSG